MVGLTPNNRLIIQTNQIPNPNRCSSIIFNDSFTSIFSKFRMMAEYRKENENHVIVKLNVHV